jgi:hypothetical protein
MFQTPCGTVFVNSTVTPKILIMAFNKIFLSYKCLFKDF